MAVTPIHPGEHLAEEPQELAMSAAELARRLNVPTNRITGILNGQRSVYRRYRVASGALFRHQPRILAEPAEPVRSPGCAEDGREGDPRASEIEAP